MSLNDTDSDMYTDAKEMAEIKKKSVRWIQKTAKKDG
jgi:hypothetical protein